MNIPRKAMACYLEELQISQRGRESFLVGVSTASCLSDTLAPPHRQG
jgi:hypothetical protein